MSRKYHKHGLRGTRIYDTWHGMMQRCYNENHPLYRLYGARGISVCDEWREDVSAFNVWAMANGYRDDLTIDRIDVNGNYEPSNCRWATWKEQGNNRRTNLLLTFKGETKTAKEWAEEAGISYKTFGTRLRRGWSVEKALTTPVHQFGGLG